MPYRRNVHVRLPQSSSDNIEKTAKAVVNSPAAPGVPPPMRYPRPFAQRWIGVFVTVYPEVIIISDGSLPSIPSANTQWNIDTTSCI